ncbi:MAG TPA: ABC transporter substrate-binding protein, partial [Roseateles sp.]|nr:ABC transporter substrate-binding protein [Roseateles sp.]
MRIAAASPAASSSFAKRRQVLRQMVALTALIGGFQAQSLQAQPGAASSHATLAMVGEPQTLDPMASTADLVGTIMQHVFEPLYTFDAKWQLTPMLAEALPKVSADGKTYRITLRK